MLLNVRIVRELEQRQTFSSRLLILLNAESRILMKTKLLSAALAAAALTLPVTLASSAATPAQQAYVKASNTEGSSATAFGDEFGGSVAVSGDTVVVGGPREDSNATGVNRTGSEQDINFNSGAAYVFTGFGFGPRLALVPDVSGGYFLRFKGIPDVTYRLQRALSVTGLWTAIATNTAPTSGLIEFHDTTPLAGQAFYHTVQP